MMLYSKLWLADLEGRSKWYECALKSIVVAPDLKPLFEITFQSSGTFGITRCFSIVCSAVIKDLLSIFDEHFHGGIDIIFHVCF